MAWNVRADAESSIGLTESRHARSLRRALHAVASVDRNSPRRPLTPVACRSSGTWTRGPALGGA
jgi:uncharacterized protein YegP (UPF0339 family)